MKRSLPFCLAVLLAASPLSAQEPGWSGDVIARGAGRERIEATPIIFRHYRPFHFYGNTVRRRYYRGTVLPQPRDIVYGGQALLRR